jgi:GAF domain-containing protein
VAADRLLRILTRLGETGGEAPSFANLCQVATDLSDTKGAAIMLMAGDAPRGLLCATDDVSAHIEELQFTLGEGPGMDAHTLSTPVMEPDLVQPEAPRWIAFAPAAIGIGVRAVFAFPLVVGSVRLGALNLYRTHPGSLSDDQHADSLEASGVAARTLLTMQADTPVGVLSPQIETESNLRLVVHQASGMVSVQLGISVADALVRLRAYAVGHDLLIDEVATRVVDRRLRFEGDALGPESP